MSSPNPINVNLFNYNPATRTLSAEISELEGNKHEVGQLVLVKNFKTGNEIFFIYNSTDYDHSGEDVQAYNYESLDPNAAVKKMVIFND